MKNHTETRGMRAFASSPRLWQWPRRMFLGSVVGLSATGDMVCQHGLQFLVRITTARHRYEVWALPL